MNEKTQLESQASPQIVQVLEANGCRLFRNNRGVAKFGLRWVRYGVGPNGAGDFIGFKPVIITEAMVGHCVAVFVSAETKRPVGGEYKKEQFEWRDMIISAGGIAGIINRWGVAQQVINEWHARFKALHKNP